MEILLATWVIGPLVVNGDFIERVIRQLVVNWDFIGRVMGPLVTEELWNFLKGLEYNLSF